MEAHSPFLHEVAVTAIVVKDGKYLITRRTLAKKRFPGMWTVPGGKLETHDYASLPKDSDNAWYNVLENVVRREVREEVGLEIRNIEYVISLATLDKDNMPLLVISCCADWASGDVVLQESETDQFAWISSEEAKDYDLIDGIDEELRMVDMRRRGERSEWKRN
ncbi:MAG: NUDIX domain-containing protein [Candidatus Paceibacterota bacterium]|jgi:8-oxo-dGTP pyrophosphatase MutT (NUDIX family)